MKRFKVYLIGIGLLCILSVCRFLQVHADNTNNSDIVKYKDTALKSISIGDKECYYCIFSSNKDIKVLIDDITYKGSAISGVQNYRLDNIPKLKETEDKTYDRYSIDGNEYAFVKFKDISEDNKKVYIYFAQMPFGVKIDKFKDSEYIVSVGEPTFNDFEIDGENIKYKYYDGTYAKGWNEIDNKIYYFDETSGIAQNGWIQDTNTSEWYYLEDCVLVKGLKEIDGKKYWFNDDGKMLVNTTAPDGNTIDENGIYIETEASSEAIQE